ncbi:hypothetical protein NIS_1686 [Nitratiruptor sp. SB155-2]|nr:hypothetical protein NIS_1686 [Nitratiruptor sp. SB155-2]
MGLFSWIKNFQTKQHLSALGVGVIHPKLPIDIVFNSIHIYSLFDLLSAYIFILCRCYIHYFTYIFKIIHFTWHKRKNEYSCKSMNTIRHDINIK